MKKHWNKKIITIKTSRRDPTAIEDLKKNAYYSLFIQYAPKSI